MEIHEYLLDNMTSGVSACIEDNHELTHQSLFVLHQFHQLRFHFPHELISTVRIRVQFSDHFHHSLLQSSPHIFHICHDFPVYFEYACLFDPVAEKETGYSETGSFIEPADSVLEFKSKVVAFCIMQSFLVSPNKQTENDLASYYSNSIYNAYFLFFLQKRSQSEFSY